MIGKRFTGIHMTIRDVDTADFDVDKLVSDFKRLHVDMFTFFTGGYVTTYQTELGMQRISPYLSPGRDLAGEIASKAAAAGITPLAMIDLGILPLKAADAHPDWAKQDLSGNFEYLNRDNVNACVMGGWQKEYSNLIVQEIADRFPDIKGIKFGGGSYGFGKSICHCPNCRKAFKEYSGYDIPEGADSPVYDKYLEWRFVETSKRVKELYGMVRSIRPDWIVMGNSVCFGDPDWTIGSTLDQEELVMYQDIVQIEAQLHLARGFSGRDAYFQPIMFPSEESLYMSSITDRSVVIVSPYFLAWPWRRSAMEYAEQKVWLYQVIATGGNPMINLSGGAPQHHEDKRGFKAIEEVFGFYKENIGYFENDEALGDVAIVYSQGSLCRYGDGALDSYLSEFRGWEEALLSKHIPYGIIPSDAIGRLSERFRALILPQMACVSKDELGLICDYVRNGGVVIASGGFGTDCDDPRLDELMGVKHCGCERNFTWKDGKLVQSYGVISKANPFHIDLGEASLFPLDGYAFEFESKGALIAAEYMEGFRVFPEGLSYPEPEIRDIRHPLISVNHYGKGSFVYMGWSAGRELHETGVSDILAIMTSIVRSYIPDETISIFAPESLWVFQRRQGKRVNLHLINTTGRSRFIREVIPAHDISIKLPPSLCGAECYAVKLGRKISPDSSGMLRVPVIDDYELISIG